MPKPTDQSRPKPLIVNGIFFISWEDNRFGGALGMADCLGGAPGTARFISFVFLYGLVLTVVIPPWRSVEWTLSAVITWC